MLYTVQLILVYTFVFGSIYLLISLGFSLVCGVLRVFHLGYGVTFLVAVYAVWFFMKELGLGLIPAILAMIVVQCTFTLGVIYFPIVKRYFQQEEILLTGLLLVMLIVEEAVNHRYPITAGVNLQTALLPGVVQIGPASIPGQMLVAAGIALATTFLLLLFLLKTRIGMVIRAVSQSTEAAQLMGANIQGVYSLAMILSVIPPTICMLAIAPFWSIEPLMAGPLLQIAILVAILGGLGNIRGGLMAAYIVGFVAASVAFLVDPRMVSLAILAMVFVVLLVRPEGIARSESLW